MCICLACVIDVFLEFLFVFSTSDWEWWRLRREHLPWYVASSMKHLLHLTHNTKISNKVSQYHITHSVMLFPFLRKIFIVRLEKKLQIQNNVPDPSRKIQSKEKYCSQSNYFLFSSATPLIQWMHCAKFLHFRCPSF